MENQSTAYPPFATAFADEVAILILNNIPDAVLLIDATLHIWAFNQKAKEEIWRTLKIKVMPGTPALDLVKPARRRLMQALMDDVLKGETRTTQNQPTTGKGGTETFENYFSPFRNTDGVIVGILARSVNITEKVKASRAIQEAEERWQFAFEASNQAAWDWNMQTDEVIYSSSYKKMYGFLGDELSNALSEWQLRIHPEDKKRMDKAIEEHVQSDNPYYETTYRIQLKNGEYKWIMARGKLLEKDSEGRPLRMIGTHTDLTQTLQTKAEIKKMNQRFHYAAKASSQALWEWDTKTGEAYVSPSFTEMFGWQVDENKHFDQWHQYVHPDDHKATVGGYYHILEHTADSIWQATYRFLKADGSYAIVSDKAYILRNEQNEVVKVIGATQDITALKKVEEELLRSNERFDTMMKATHDMLWDWDILANTTYRSPEGLKCVLGVSNEDSINTHEQWLARLHPDDRGKIQEILACFSQADHHQTFELEYRFLRDDGIYTDIYDRGILLKNEEGKPVRMIGAAQNISERKRMEAELLNNELDMKKRINQATVDSQEQERTEIGCELHDNINQMLTTTKLYLELAVANKDMTEELVKKSGENISSVINEIRQLSRSLMDPTIGDLGIVDAIRDLTENLNLTGKVVITLSIDEAIEDLLNKNQKLTIYRIIQESLNNVIRHADATFVSIRICRQNDEITLLIKDDGQGFLQESVKKGAGLKNITNRVYLINGNFVLESSPGKGCTIKINFPINN